MCVGEINYHDTINVDPEYPYAKFLTKALILDHPKISDYGRADALDKLIGDELDMGVVEIVDKRRVIRPDFIETVTLLGNILQSQKEYLLGLHESAARHAIEMTIAVVSQAEDIGEDIFNNLTDILIGYIQTPDMQFADDDVLTNHSDIRESIREFIQNDNFARGISGSRFVGTLIGSLGKGFNEEEEKQILTRITESVSDGRANFVTTHHAINSFGTRMKNSDPGDRVLLSQQRGGMFGVLAEKLEYRMAPKEKEVMIDKIIDLSAFISPRVIAWAEDYDGTSADVVSYIAIFGGFTGLLTEAQNTRLLEIFEPISDALEEVDQSELDDMHEKLESVISDLESGIYIIS